jgi:hypothetical protein
MSRRMRPCIPSLTRAGMSCFHILIVSLLAGDFVLADDAAVSSVGQRFIMKTADRVRSSQIKTMGVTGEQRRQSFPIPVIRPDGLHVLFLYYPAQAIPRQPSKLWPPDFLLSLEASGRFEELRAVTSREFGQFHQPDEIIGTYGLPEGMTYEQYDQKLARLNEVYDVLLPEFSAGRSEVGPEIVSAAREFADLFDLLSEPPLKPYYAFLGRDFFAWINQVSARRSQGHDLGPGHPPESPRVLGDSVSRTSPAVLGPRSIEDDIAIDEEKNQVVEHISEEPGNGRYGIGFQHLAGIYWVRRDSPKSSDWLALLKQSRSEKRPVNFHYVGGWSQITYVELAQPCGSRALTGVVAPQTGPTPEKRAPLRGGNHAE